MQRGPPVEERAVVASRARHLRRSKPKVGSARGITHTGTVVMKRTSCKHGSKCDAASMCSLPHAQSIATMPSRQQQARAQPPVAGSSKPGPSHLQHVYAEAHAQPGNDLGGGQHAGPHAVPLLELLPKGRAAGEGAPQLAHATAVRSGHCSKPCPHASTRPAGRAGEAPDPTCRARREPQPRSSTTLAGGLPSATRCALIGWASSTCGGQGKPLQVMGARLLARQLPGRAMPCAGSSARMQHTAAFTCRMQSDSSFTTAAVWAASGDPSSGSARCGRTDWVALAHRNRHSQHCIRWFPPATGPAMHQRKRAAAMQPAHPPPAGKPFALRTKQPCGNTVFPPECQAQHQTARSPAAAGCP